MIVIHSVTTVSQTELVVDQTETGVIVVVVVVFVVVILIVLVVVVVVIQRRRSVCKKWVSFSFPSFTSPPESPALGGVGSSNTLWCILS